jgi:Protein of unknown function (DUF3224)
MATTLVISRSGRWACPRFFERFVFVLALLLFATGVARAQTSALSGDWTGESICVGEVGACKDEQVVYHVSVDSADETKVKIGADKIVNGKPDFMGDIVLKYDARNNTLTGNLDSPRGRGLWEFTVKGNMMWGTLSQLPEKKIVRQIRLTKTEPNQGKTTMTQHATGTFEVKITPTFEVKTYPQDDKTGDASMGRMSFEKQWRGEIQGTSTGQMLTGGDVKTGWAGYVAMEKFTGSVKGRKGTLIFQHSATMTAGKGDLTITVVPSSGTEDLKGISGRLTIKIEDGKHFYDFEFNLPPQ